MGAIFSRGIFDSQFDSHGLGHRRIKCTWTERGTRDSARFGRARTPFPPPFTSVTRAQIPPRMTDSRQVAAASGASVQDQPNVLPRRILDTRSPAGSTYIFASSKRRQQFPNRFVSNTLANHSSARRSRRKSVDKSRLGGGRGPVAPPVFKTGLAANIVAGGFDSLPPPPTGWRTKFPDSMEP